MKMIPKINLRTGMMGLVSANLSYKLNISNYSSNAKYFALNSVSLFSASRFPLHLLNHPASSLLAFYWSIFFIYYPSFSNPFIALTMLSFVFFISSDFLAFGRCLNQFIISRGKANNPTPPNRTTKIQPKKDIMAIIQTANDAQSSNV